MIPPTEVPFEDIFGKIDQYIGIPDVSSGDGILRDESQCREWAETIGCNLYVATDHQLFIDLDTEAQYQQFLYQIKLFRKHFYYKTFTISPSKQGLPHRHVIVDLGDAYPLITRIAMQSVLGSDPTRELLSIRRALNKEDNVVIFFEKQ